MNTYTAKIPDIKKEQLKDFFVGKNVLFEPMQYTYFRAKGNGFVAVLYNSGKFVLQGSDVSEIANQIEQKFFGKEIKLNVAESIDNKVDEFIPHIGVDESGKGDYFGPLIIAGVFVDDTNYQRFINLGVKDSKQLKYKDIKKMAIEIKNNSIFSVVTISPEKYNELYSKFKNLNKLLAWGHARVIENILEKTSAEYALSDKFADESLIQRALMDKGRQIRLEQRTKAESDIAVACGSILARYEFVKNMENISQKIGIELPKGASNKTIETGVEICQKYGKEKLIQVAKMHFKTTQDIYLKY